ncbi:hypothetical protein BJ508DRAFT_46739 [Ascobolus immersus RN42]|uniref:Uncharacterized protein n=1 Tax=Ascobolus immersus RN42 TaxID=1160509 RepID=A0A3N4IIN0_ASCIM|nr:hypothetical protein BJ508DRAFT_46739 [Ascobolus immersus RN42]
MSVQYRAAMTHGADRLQWVASEGNRTSEVSEKLWCLVSRLVWDIRFVEHFECWYRSPVLNIDGPKTRHSYGARFGVENWALAKTRFQAFEIFFEEWRNVTIRPELLLVESDLADVLARYYPKRFDFAAWTMDWESSSRTRYKWDTELACYDEEVSYDLSCLVEYSSENRKPLRHLDEKGSWPSMLEVAAFFGAENTSYTLITCLNIPPSMPGNYVLWAAMIGVNFRIFDMLLDHEHPDICSPNEFGETLLEFLPMALQPLRVSAVIPTPETVRLYLVHGRVIEEYRDPLSLIKAGRNLSIYKKLISKGAKTYGQLGFRLLGTEEIEIVNVEEGRQELRLKEVSPEDINTEPDTSSVAVTAI